MTDLFQHMFFYFTQTLYGFIDKMCPMIYGLQQMFL